MIGSRNRCPHTGFDPMDGHDPRVTLSPDNPCLPANDHHDTPDEGTGL